MICTTAIHSRFTDTDRSSHNPKAGHMTSVATSIPDLYPGRRQPVGLKFALALGLVALADWLFYGERPGISLVLFTLALICGSLTANFDGLDRRRAIRAALIFLAGLVPAIEDLNPLSFIFLVLALGSGVAILTNPNLTRLRDGVIALRDLFLIGPFRSIADAAGLLNLSALSAGFVLWFVPLALGCVFVFLLASANPLIEKWLALLDLGSPASHINKARLLFWVAILLAVWPFIQLRWRRGIAIDLDRLAPDSIEPAAGEEELPGVSADFLSAPTILRSLILFNLLFSVQTVLDMIYLWGDGKLPADVTYADYAHRGAYPLIVTAVLAAGFVLIAMRPDGPAEDSRITRPLVYLFVAQNVMLVASSIQRLHLYVEIYQLTYWRIAAFIWMLLVAIGLVLIVARIVLRRPNEWLIGANLISLTATLYICALIDFAPMIADHNVAHSLEAGGHGVNIDTAYLVGLGPQVLPAIDKALRLLPDNRCLVSGRAGLVEQQRQIMASWRSWGFQSFRLQRYLDQQQNQPASG
jgi:Domain of unknown function (DUF4173)